MSESQATFILSAATPDQLPHGSLARVAMLGRSNVGKSSLINSLAKQKNLSRTSATPGRTRLINLFRFPSGFELVDLPGYGYAKAAAQEKEIFQRRIIEFLNHDEHLKLAVVITDSRIGATELDQQMIAELQRNEIPVLVIANKIDKLSNNQRANALKALRASLPSLTILSHSAETSEGRGEILDAIQRACKS